ncbi:MAG: hypothetical protein IKB22_06635 [Lentisphaeria bacterium]|nr:hypothetical protein [Lentisphaeria bacterium]
MKKWLRCTLPVILALLSVFALLPLQRGKINRSDWMAQLDDSAALHELTIPGTHDSGALYSLADVVGKCQTLPIREQLKIGVRFFDIRLQLVDNSLKLVHSIVDQMTDLEAVLEDMILFLRENPSEFLLVSFKEDADPRRSDADFAESLEQALLSYPEISHSTTLPASVGDARGKLHIIARYKNASVGIPCYDGWQDDTSFVLNGLYVQDNYQVKSSGEKLFDIAETFTIADELRYALVLNFTSCYVSPSFPPIYAGVPAHDINRWLSEGIAQSTNTVGVIVCDFITSELADIIIERNFQ